MGKIQNIKNVVEEARQHHHERRLNKDALKEYADDPDVEFVFVSDVEDHNAPHGVNLPGEMEVSAESVEP